MKHLKKFEELNISTYLKAGELLRKGGHSKRGDKMIDWAMKGELDKTPELNLWIKWMNEYQARGINPGTKKGIISDSPIKVRINSIHVNLDMMSEDIEYHKEENNFPVSISLGFKIDESELEKVKSEYIKCFKDECKSSSGFKLYPMELYISFKLDENGHISENPKLSIFSYNEIGAMFSDRRSANNFKTILKKVLSNEIKVYTYYKDEDDDSPMTNSESILDRIPKLIPTIDISDVEIILDTFKNINTNSLYADDPNDALKRISS
jgi:hypothetical protein